MKVDELEARLKTLENQVRILQEIEEIEKNLNNHVGAIVAPRRKRDSSVRKKI